MVQISSPGTHWHNGIGEGPLPDHRTLTVDPKTFSSGCQKDFEKLFFDIRSKLFFGSNVKV
jgi:hypothetical protein